MSNLDALLQARGVSEDLGAHVTAAVFNRAGSHAAFGLGDGTIRLFAAGAWTNIAAHDGAVLSLAPGISDTSFCSGGDDGIFLRAGVDRETAKIAEFPMKWVDHVASWAGPKSSPLLACSVGKNLHLFTAAGEKIRSLPHPSTVTGLVFDGKGKRIAASHYNGASLWFTGSNSETPTLLEWKGSHTGVTLHPNGEALVTTMQENALHGWSLPEKKHMRMSGYPAKTESMGFTKSGRWLATGGADAIVLWPFFGGGPMGKAPMELAASEGAFVKRVACHPEHEVVAAGFDNGMVVVADTVKEKILAVCGPGRGAVTALCWNASGSHLALGTATGFAAIVDFSPQG
jgi:WD40 repeat protein